MALDAKELGALLDELLEAWDTDGRPTVLRQRRAKGNRKLSTFDLALMWCVLGLTHHVHETARSIKLLVDAGHYNSAIPLVRAVYECALTAVWLAQSKDDDAVKAYLHEHSRQRYWTSAHMKRAVVATFRENASKVADVDMSMFAGSQDKAGKFDKLCDDLTPGGAEAYTLYRILSSLSHAGVGVVDLYWYAPTSDSDLPRARPKPRRALSTDVLLFLTADSMVWSGRAVSYLSKNNSYRSVLRDVARQLEITSEIQLSEVYHKRHPVSRKKRAAASASQPPTASRRT